MVPTKQADQHELMQNIWTPDDQSLLKRLKEDIMEIPMLSIPDPSQIFYVNAEWSKDVMEVMLLQ